VDEPPYTGRRQQGGGGVPLSNKRKNLGKGLFRKFVPKNTFQRGGAPTFQNSSFEGKGAVGRRMLSLKRGHKELGGAGGTQRGKIFGKNRSADPIWEACMRTWSGVKHQRRTVELIDRTVFDTEVATGSERKAELQKKPMGRGGEFLEEKVNHSHRADRAGNSHDPRRPATIKKALSTPGREKNLFQSLPQRTRPQGLLPEREKRQNNRKQLKRRRAFYFEKGNPGSTST